MMFHVRPFFRITLLVGLFVLAGISSVGAAQQAINPLSIEGPVANQLPVMATSQLPVLATRALDISSARAEDVDREAMGLPPRFAIPEYVDVTPENSGVWEDLEGPYSLWRYRVIAPGAISLNFGFTAYHLPKGSRLTIYPADATTADDIRGVRVFTERDNADHGQLWTPVIVSDNVVIELVLADEFRHDYELELTAVNRGYRYFGEDIADQLQDKSGTCNIDVVCPEGDPWRDEIPAVGVISTGGSTFCTGFMVNNTAEDATPFFMTANHCGVNTGNAASLVVYWNFESPVCGQQGGGNLNDFSTGSTWLAGNSTSDFTLVQLDSPVDPAYNVSYAGWDNTSNDPVQAIAIHHPNTDEKSISFEFDPTVTSSYLGTTSPGDGTHIRVIDWDLGTTEPGSSGSPLFDQNHHIVGQLHGGYAACGNDLSDYYGRFSRSWPNLAPFLDPLGTGATALDTYVPGQSGLAVAPFGVFFAMGDQGGPFVPASQTYVLTNQNLTDLNYQVSADVPWLDIASGSGLIPAGGTATVTATVNAQANTLVQGLYNGVISFLNLTDGDGDTTRAAHLQVGVPSLAYSYALDSDPGWTMGAGWEFGIPQGLGGQHGNPDPVAGYTGGNVLGYNLAGDYPNNLAVTSMISTPIDCSNLSGVSVKFWRWLGVESPSYDHAFLSASNDGVNFTTIWQNTGEITDSAWTQVEYDISAVADGQATVYLAWTLGPTDSSYQFCGWNIDDVEIWGLSGSAGGMTLTLTPHNAPIQIPAVGGQFTYDVNLQTDSAVTISAVFDAVLPNGVVYPVMSPPAQTLAPGNHDWLNLTQNVPDFAPAGVYTYRCRITATDGQMVEDSFTFEKLAVAKAGSRVTDWKLSGWNDGDRPADLPGGFALRGASPNPFNPMTTIAFDLPHAVTVRLDIYDVAGRRVRSLLQGQVMAAGNRTVVWNGQDNSGRQAATGVYFYRLQAGEFTDTGRMMLVK